MAEKKTNIVVMKDGREVDFGVRGKLKKVIEIVGEGNERLVNLSFDCINGDTHTMSFGADSSLFYEFAAHGVSQKISDSITKAEAADDVSFGVSNQIDQLLAGTWVQRSSEGLVRGFSDLLEALRRIKGFEVGSPELAALKANLAKMSEAEIKLLRTNSGIKQLLLTIASEKAIAKAKKMAEAEEESGSSLDDFSL